MRPADASTSADMVARGYCCASCFTEFKQRRGEAILCELCAAGSMRRARRILATWRHRERGKPAAQWTHDRLWKAACWAASVITDGRRDQRAFNEMRNQ